MGGVMRHRKRPRGAVRVRNIPQAARLEARAGSRLQPADELLLVVFGVIVHWIMVVVFTHAVHPVM
jgi:hypothetical protein